MSVQDPMAHLYARLEGRLDELTSHVDSLRLGEVSMKGAITSLASAVETLAKKVDAIHDLSNRVRGAFWLACLVSSAVGAICMWVLVTLARKGLL